MKDGMVSGVEKQLNLTYGEVFNLSVSGVISGVTLNFGDGTILLMDSYKSISENNNDANGWCTDKEYLCDFIRWSRKCFCVPVMVK